MSNLNFNSPNINIVIHSSKPNRVTPTMTPTVTPTVTPTMTPTVTPTMTPTAESLILDRCDKVGLEYLDDEILINEYLNDCMFKTPKVDEGPLFQYNHNTNKDNISIKEPIPNFKETVCTQHGVSMDSLKNYFK